MLISMPAMRPFTRAEHGVPDGDEAAVVVAATDVVQLGLPEAGQPAEVRAHREAVMRTESEYMLDSLVKQRLKIDEQEKKQSRTAQGQQLMISS